MLQGSNEAAIEQLPQELPQGTDTETTLVAVLTTATHEYRTLFAVPT